MNYKNTNITETSVTEKVQFYRVELLKFCYIKIENKNARIFSVRQHPLIKSRVHGKYTCHITHYECNASP